MRPWVPAASEAVAEPLGTPQYPFDQERYLARQSQAKQSWPS